MKDNINISAGAGPVSLLTILFIGLKLTGYIDWSWKWVLAPLWIPVVLSGAILLIAGLILLLAWRSAK